MQLNAGPIQINYETGFLRCLTANGEEVLRMIYFALRDRDWNTAQLTITNETVQSDGNSFSIQYDWQTTDLGIQMAGNTQISGHADGSISVDWFGKARNTFWRNRAGFCVLHPITGLTGQPCWIENPAGETTEGTFPNLISPNQSFLNVHAMTWQMASGQQFRVDFEGDVFETEDQRNWTDASYKTYCTPQVIPFPVEVQAGTEVTQQVKFRIEKLEAVRINTNSTLAFQPEPVTTKPWIGLGHCSGCAPLTAAEAESLRQASFSHLRVDVFFADSHWMENLLAASRDASLLHLPLELALFFWQNAVTDAQTISKFLQDNRINSNSILLFQGDTWITSDSLLNQVVPIFRKLLPAVKLGGGTDSNFVDLNRHRFNFDQVDFVTYSVNPQVHAFDDQTLMENTEAQADTVRSARQLSGNKPVHVSPVTLLPRFNPAAASADVISPSGRSLPPVDPRHKTEFGAEWTRRSLKALSEAGAESITYYETHGPRGLVNGEEHYPVFAVFKNL